MGTPRWGGRWRKKKREGGVEGKQGEAA